MTLAIAGAAPRLSAQPAADAGRAMVTALAAPRPHPSIGEEAQLFDRFVGSWDCEYTFHAADGTVTRASGELLFGWILDGRVLQDIWISFPKDPAKERNIGTSLRWFDATDHAWHVFFVNPLFGSNTVRGGAEGDRIVLRGNDGDGSALRWSFNDITPDAFVWRGERSRDGGRTWTLEEEHHMKRRVAAR